VVSHSNKQLSPFVTTQWTRVLEARGNAPEAKAALSELCSAYYEPVFAFMRRHSRDEDCARELTQEFFARILARRGFDSADPEKGRFRSFLLGAAKHFLADARDHANRLKRCAGQPPEPLERADTDASPGLQLADEHAASPDREFDRKWAMTVLDRALGALAEEQKASGKWDYFEVLKPWLTGDTEDVSQADAALRLGMNEGAVKVAIHRLRRRFRELLKLEVGKTIRDPTLAQAELGCLVAALGKG
jgi:RNA polymerase sigma-70 factor (ECF subfamily)